MSLQTSIGSLWVNIILNIVSSNSDNNNKKAKNSRITLLINRLKRIMEDGDDLERSSCTFWLSSIAKLAAFKSDVVDEIRQLLTIACADKNQFTGAYASQGLAYCFLNETNYIRFMIDNIVYEKIDKKIADIGIIKNHNGKQNIVADSDLNGKSKEEIINEILGVDPNIWYYLCRKNDNEQYFQLIKWLIKNAPKSHFAANFSVNKIFFTNSLKETTMILASKTGNLPLMKLLIDNGFNTKTLLNYKSKHDNRSVFLNLCYFGYLECLDYVMKIEGNVEQDYEMKKEEDKRQQPIQQQQTLQPKNNTAVKWDKDGLKLAFKGDKDCNERIVQYLLLYAPLNVLTNCDASGNNIFHYIAESEKLVELFGAVFVVLQKRTQDRTVVDMLDTINNNGESPMHIACENSNVKLLELLNKYNVGITNVNKQEYINSYTPLMIAMRKSDLNMIKILLEIDGIDIVSIRSRDSGSGLELSSLEHAIQYAPTAEQAIDTNTDTLEIIKLLFRYIIKQCSINQETDFFTHPVFNIELILNLLKFCTKESKIKKADNFNVFLKQMKRIMLDSQIGSYSQNKSLDKIYNLIGYETKATETDTALFTCLMNSEEHLDLAKQLLDNGANVNSMPEAHGKLTAMHCIVISAKPSSVQATLAAAKLVGSYGFDGKNLINTTCNNINIFWYCCCGGHIELLDYLLKQYKNINVFYQISGIGGLGAAIAYEHVEMVKYLLETVYNKNSNLVLNKASAVAGNAAGNAFLLAARLNSAHGLEIMQLLLKHGANANSFIYSDGGIWTTTLHFVCASNATKSLRFMLENNLCPNIDQKQSANATRTVLEIALNLNNMDIAKLLCIYRKDRDSIKSALQQVTRKSYHRTTITIDKFKLVLKWLINIDDEKNESTKSQLIDEKMLQQIKDDPGTHGQFDTLLSELIQIFKNPNHKMIDIVNHISNESETKEDNTDEIIVTKIKCDEQHPMVPSESKTISTSKCFMCQKEKTHFSHMCSNVKCAKKLCTECNDAWNKAWAIEHFAQNRVYGSLLTDFSEDLQMLKFSDKIEQVVDDPNVMKIVKFDLFFCMLSLHRFHRL